MIFSRLFKWMTYQIGLRKRVLRIYPEEQVGLYFSKSTPVLVRVSPAQMPISRKHRVSL